MNVFMRPFKMLAAVGALAALTYAGDYSTWARYRPVTLSTTGMGLSAAVANVPILVRFKATAHKDMLDSASTQVQANGSDIRVTKADGTTDVPFEIERLVTGPGGRLDLWILVDNVTANNPNAATFRVYWGRTGQTTMSNPAATFPTSAGYQAVFHLNDTGSTIVNSANSSLNGVATGTTTIVNQNAGNGVVSAKAGARVRTFGTTNNGVDNSTPATDYITISPTAGHILSTHTGSLTFEGWIYSSITNSGNTSAGTKTIVAHGDGNNGTKAWFARTAALDGSNGQNHYSAGGPNNIIGPVAPFGEQHHWQFVTAVWNGTNWTIYRNRENDPWNNPTVSGPTGMTPDSVTYKTIPGTSPTASTMPWFVGAMSDSTGANPTRGWQGWMDEVRISTVARDSNYVKLTFLTSRADTLGSGVIHPVAIGGTELPGTGPYANWTGHRSIVLNTSATGANVAGTVTNFPLLVRLDKAEAAIIASAKAGGADIRFSKADNATALPYQIESWGSTTAAIWVKVDTIKGNNATQTIRMHWGNPAANSESDGAAVFDTANSWSVVYHMNGGTGTTELDATANGLNMSASDTVPGAVPGTAPGMVGGARDFAGDASTIQGRQYFVAPNSAANTAVDATTNTPHTISAWVYARSISALNGHGNSIFNKGDRQFAMQIYGNAGDTSKLWESAIYTSTWRQAKSKNVATKGAWYHITGTWAGGANGGNGTGKLYVNGKLDTTISLGIGTTNPTRTYNLFIGANPSAGGTNVAAPGTARGLAAQTTNVTNPRYWDGFIDEVSLSRTVRSDDFVKLSYESQKTVNSLTDIGLPVYTAPGAPTGVTAVADTAAAVISWVAPADDGGKPILSYKATVVGDTTITCSSSGLSCKITGLALGTQFNFVVRAINEVGGGPNSTGSNQITPISPVVPGKPLSVTAVTSGSSTIAVAWSVPAYNGGATITGYTVTGVPGGTCTTTGIVCVVSGLTQGTQYKFTVVATNAIGNSLPSDTATATTTGILPGAFVIAMDGSRSPYTYRLPEASVASTEKLSMIISDVRGKRIWTRTINPSATKVREVTWNGTTASGQDVAPGLYVVRIQAVVNGKSIEGVNTGIKQ